MPRKHAEFVLSLDVPQTTAQTVPMQLPKDGVGETARLRRILLGLRSRRDDLRGWALGEADRLDVQQQTQLAEMIDRSFKDEAG